MPKKLTCTCPDFTRQQTFVVNTYAFSKTFNRSWIDSNAGVNEGQYCKHIWATLLHRKEVTKDMIPNDMPVPIEPKDKESYGVERWQPEYGGHSFTPKGGFGLEKFKPYKGG